MANTNDNVQELQGLYGPFTIAERVVQKIWLRRDFDTNRAGLTDGRNLVVLAPGRWNLLGGPDFRGARLRIDDRELTGDIEVHFHSSDWRAHGHGSDGAYNNVVLHVVMFPFRTGEHPVCRSDGTEIPTLVLLPLLHRSLEEYASDDSLENITARDAAERIAGLRDMLPDKLRPWLRDKAAERWALKVRFAKLRIDRLGWVGAAHHTALEILGYRHNRAAMLSVACRNPLEAWGEGLNPENIFLERAGEWQMQGVRPANQPRLRLRQYGRWTSAHPDWPVKLYQMIPDHPGGTVEAIATSQARKQLGLGRLRASLAREVMAEAIGGSRLDTMICDGFLPLLTAASGEDLSGAWFHWYLGDLPWNIRRALSEAGIAGRGATPLCHGWGQGLLAWMMEHEARASG